MWGTNMNQKELEYKDLCQNVYKSYQLASEDDTFVWTEHCKIEINLWT